MELVEERKTLSRKDMEQQLKKYHEYGYLCEIKIIDSNDFYLWQGDGSKIYLYNVKVYKIA